MVNTQNNNITVKTNDLVECLNSIKVAKNSKKFNQTLKIEAGNNPKLVLGNFGKNTNFVETEIISSSELDSPIYLNFFELLDTVKDLKDISENIDITVDENNIQVTADYLSIKLDNLDHLNWEVPDREIDYKNKKYFKFNTMDKTEFRKLIKDLEHLKKFAANDNNQIPVITGVNFKVIDNTLKMEAIDGFRIMFSEYPIIDNNENFDFIISSETFDTLIKVLKNNIQNENVVGIERTERGLVIGVNGVSIYGEVMEGNFFDTSSIYMPPENEKEIKITLNKANFEKTLKTMKKFLNDENRCMVIDSSELENNVMVTDYMKNITATFPGAPGTFRAGFNSNFILDALSNITDKEVTLTLEKDQEKIAPCYIFDQNNCYEILPVRLND